MATPRGIRTGARVLPPRPFLAAGLMLLFTFALYLIEAYDLATDGSLDAECIVPRQTSGLDGVLFAPLLHAGLAHLDSNAPFFLIFGFLAMAGGFRRFLGVTSVIWVVSGIGVWLVSPPGSCTVGASGLIFGWLMFLLFRGFFAGSLKQIGLALVLLFFWGGILFGVLPGDPGVSWQAHLFGALAGVLCARTVARADRRRAHEQSTEVPVIRQ